MAPTFDRPTLELLDGAKEVDIETVRPDGTSRRRTIWIVVDSDDVFVRSVRGDRGYWYQAARENPDQISLHVRGRTLPVRAEAATDDDSVDRCSRALTKKYRPGASTESMLVPNVLGTTLRLEPR